MREFGVDMKFGAVLIAVLLAGCNPKGKPITYGEDKCEFCRMSIVDQRFGGEVVTNKGKIFKFDAVECTINYLDQEHVDETKVKLILTNTYDSPGELVDVLACFYLKSENMPSPMGMYLNPFGSSSEALKYQKENKGIVLNWDELRTDFVGLR